LIGPTNMTEFAFCGVGIDPHYGTPLRAIPVTDEASAAAHRRVLRASVADGGTVLAFAGFAYWKIPNRLSREANPSRAARVPFLRLGTLAAGVLFVAASGPVMGSVPRVLMAAAAVTLVALTFRLDRQASDNLFPRGACRSMRRSAGIVDLDIARDDPDLGGAVSAPLSAGRAPGVTGSRQLSQHCHFDGLNDRDFHGLRVELAVTGRRVGSEP
jgi:hypothetical protein